MTQTEAFQIEVDPLKQAALVYRAINNPLRQQMLRLIDQSGRITVTQLYSKMRLEQSVASQHLAILRSSGFVNTERDRRFIFYSVNYKRINDLVKISSNLLEGLSDDA